MKTQIYLNEIIYNTLKEIAIKDDINVQEVIKRAIMYYLSNYLNGDLEDMTLPEGVYKEENKT